MTYMREICVKFPKEFGKGPVIALLEIYLKTKRKFAIGRGCFAWYYAVGFAEVTNNVLREANDPKEGGIVPFSRESKKLRYK